MKFIYNDRGEKIGTILEGGEGNPIDVLGGIVLVVVMYFATIFSPFIAYHKGKKVREENQGYVNKFDSMLICWFLGLIGGHKFYEGNITMGLLYYFTGGLFGIGFLYDFFSLCFRKVDFYDPNVKISSEDSKKAKILTIIFFVIIPLILLAVISAMSR